jgi:polyphenol oxidase
LANPQRRRYLSQVTAAFPFLNPLNAIPGIRAAWLERVPDFPITGNRDEAMRLLRPQHTTAVANFGGTSADWWRAEQIHGTQVAHVPDSPQILAPDGLPVVPAADGLVTSQTGVVLSIYTADCGAIWLADAKTGAIGLLHSGKKGTEGNILQAALDMMAEKFGTHPQDVTAVLSPCIRPPDYEVDFAAEIDRQATRAGLRNFFDCGLNTAADLTRFYSYRREQGKTGRMMALIIKDFTP